MASSPSGNEDRDHISDLAFQAIVLEHAGVKVGRTFIVHLDKEYVRSGALDVEAMFVKDDSSQQVAERRAQISGLMEGARAYLNREDEPSGGCDCHYLGRSRHCTTFAFSHPEVPSYAVHDIVRIGSSTKKLADLVEHRIFALDDVPHDFELGEAQANQVRVHKSRKPEVAHDRVEAALAEYAYPLYFFDYETFAPATPAFDGFSPYQRIPFQFSLHILREPGGALEHVEYLHEVLSDPSVQVGELLSEHIAPGEAVVVWHAPFERGVNADIAERMPLFASAIERINGQLRDLEKIFTEQHYVHPGFRGRTSIKNVLPVLCPELSYGGLTIKEGATASNEWWRMVGPTTDVAEKSTIAKALREYCALDTFAMYAIWSVLGEQFRT